MLVFLIILTAIIIAIWLASRAIKKKMAPNTERQEKMAEAENDFERAHATVLWATYYQDYPDPGHARYGIHLEIDKADGTKYKHTDGNPARKEEFWVIRKGDMVYLKKGEVLPVRIHKGDPRWVFFEFEFE